MNPFTFTLTFTFINKHLTAPTSVRRSTPERILQPRILTAPLAPNQHLSLGEGEAKVRPPATPRVCSLYRRWSDLRHVVRSVELSPRWMCGACELGSLREPCVCIYFFFLLSLPCET